MTVTVTDPDFNFSELDWKSFRYKQYAESSSELVPWSFLLNLSLHNPIDLLQTDSCLRAEVEKNG